MSLSIEIITVDLGNPYPDSNWIREGHTVPRRTSKFNMNAYVIHSRCRCRARHREGDKIVFPKWDDCEVEVDKPILIQAPSPIVAPGTHNSTSGNLCINY